MQHLSTKQLESLADLVTKAASDAMARRTAALEQRLAGLEARIEGMQTKADKGLTFAGEFQPALAYPQGTLVKNAGGALFVAIKAIPAGGSCREGSGWVKVT